MPTLLGSDPFRVFDDLFGALSSEVLWSATPVTVKHDHDHALISVDMPGVDRENLDVTFERGALSIVGRRGEQTYRYQVTLGDDIDPDAIEADLDKGVLTIRAARKPEARPRKIALKGGGSETKRLDSGEST